MRMLAKNKKTIFIGQSVKYSGNAIFNTLIDVSDKKKIEFPVAEEMQMGITTGLALNNIIPVTIFP